MKFLTLLLTASTAAFAAPAASPDNELAARQNNLIYPHATFRYFINTGQVLENPQDQPLVLKNGNAADESSAIVTFQFGEELKGRTCKLLFDLGNQDVSTGSHQMDVFSVINPPGSEQFTVATIPRVRPALSRDQHRGRIEVFQPGSATWILSYGGYPQFPCPVNELMGIEFVGVGDSVEVRWQIGATGPRIQPL
ncbi:hypothetical protein PRK78_000198 [Emydomyces testavorans]|uniref:Ubiquitin 3 binding protein But2 C-terminal domain-containing protein n=1 Tax=Emydomyces testavorans TaxID=2070801 RepID=A0AAF0DAJ2_9EURO|nr:hypothetical protein PRK78_000198 [Emydomyces testavorans]